MNLAVASTTPDMTGLVPSLFSQTEYILILEEERLFLQAAIPRHGGEDTRLARAVLDWNCEAVICGPIEWPAFEIIADEGQVTRLDGSGLRVSDAIHLYLQNQLPYIRDYIGGDGCTGH